MTIAERAGLGALAGAAATLPMSLVMLACDRAGLMGEQPPRRITTRALRTATGVTPPEPTQAIASSLLHVTFGAVAGAAYATTLGRANERAPVTSGIATGLAIWAVSYAGWIPALGLLPPPWRDRPGRPGTMALAHVVFGKSLGLGLAWLMRRRRAGATAAALRRREPHARPRPRL